VGRSRADLATSVAFAALVLAWGLNYLFVRNGLLLSAPIWLAFLRAGVGALGASVLLLPRVGGRALSGRDRWWALVLGLPNTALFFGLWFIAATSILPGEVAVVVYTFPLWVALLSGPVLGLPLRRGEIIAVVVGFSGIVLVSEPWRAGAAGLNPIAVLELLVGSIGWAVGTVAIQRKFPKETILAAHAYQLIGGSIGLLGAALLFEPTAAPHPSVALLEIVLWLGLVGTSFAYAVWFTLLARSRAATLSSYVFLVPVVALAASFVVFGERLDIEQAIGVAFVLAAVYLIGRAPSLKPPRGS
jgi:drug/metabolite transporter (DMT)-like permease